MQHLYTFHQTLLLRTPALPLSSQLAATREAEWLTDAQFMEALYLASPALHAECERWQRGELREAKKIAKLLGTLARYHGRMRSRCTPFGLFAGCSVVSWGSQSQLCLVPAATTRHTRLDMHYVCALAAYLARQPSLHTRLRYFPNSSCYYLGDELRYVEYQSGEAGAAGGHQVSSVDASDALRQALAASAGGQTCEVIARTLLADDAPPEELPQALAFVEELIAAQLLVSELEPTVTGPEFMQHLRQALARLDEGQEPALAHLRAVLEAASTQLLALDAQPTNASAAYEQLASTLQALPVPLERGKLFQTDLLPGVRAGGTLDQALQARLLAALHVLGHLTPPTRNERLEQFKQQFATRYEEQEVPLLEALDSESGLHYSAFGLHSYAPLVDDLVLDLSSAPESALVLSAGQLLLYHKLREAEQNRQYSVEVTLEEVRSFDSVAPALPPSLSVMFRLVGAGQQVLLEHAGGSSGANLLARFAHAAPAIEQVVQAITTTEQARNPGVVFAEICHLPASRTGNILLRPHFRAAELPYLAQSTRPPEQQVPPQDLLLSLRNGQLQLRCRRTNRLIVPRLSSAHNYTQQALPVYQFLCDLQTQGLQASLGFHWGLVAPHAKFRPRLTHQQVILQPASWHLAAADVAVLLDTPATPVALAAFCHHWQLPRLFTLADGDHELLVDVDQPASVQGWLAIMRARTTFILKEHLVDPATSPVRDEAGHPYANQFVATLLRTTASYEAPVAVVAATAVERTFELGSEWLYYKLYCGTKVADRLLREAVHPLTKELLALGLIDKWFFVRYADPDHHLRLRLRLPTVAHLGQVVQHVKAQLAPFVANGSLWKSQTDTYRREVERYGSRTMELSETLFYYDSQRLLAQPVPATADPEHTAWLGAAQGVDELLTAFAYALPQKLALLRELRDAFAREFAVNKALKLQFDAKYRQHRPALQAALATPATHRLLRDTARQVLAQQQLAPTEVSLPKLLGSYIHMLLNRAISSRARLHELLIYDFLFRYYQSQVAWQPAPG